ncbi:MAG: HEAT repeat domain-containing protein [Planctomycetota bacterium]|jgi:hypothetical protein
MEQRKMVTWLAVSTLAMVISAAALLPGSKEARRDLAASSGSPDSEELESFLRELKRTWKPETKTRRLRKAAGKVDTFKAPLLDLLADEAHPLLAEAIQLAAALEVWESRRAIVQLAVYGPEGLRSPAILAAERLEPWSQQELVQFLREGKPAVALAALQVSATRDDRPLAEIFNLLSHEDPDVRAAAAQAIPHDMDADSLDELLALARGATGDEAVHVMRALGRARPVAAVEGFLIEQLEAREQSARMAALDVLMSRTEPLHQPADVWEFAVNDLVGVTERARAFVCLERTRSFRIADIREELPRLHPYLLYFAARCLISAGETEGVGVLIHLLELDKDRFGGLEKSKVNAVLFAARKLLADLSRIAPQASTETWRRWYEGLRTLSPRALASPPL